MRPLHIIKKSKIRSFKLYLEPRVIHFVAHLCSCKPMNNPQPFFLSIFFALTTFVAKELVLTAKLVHAIAQGLVQQYQQERQTRIQYWL